MKKIFYFVFLAVIITACNPPKEYKITGTIDVPSFFDSTKVMLSQRVNREWVDMDSAEILNGKFELKGVADTAKIAYLRFKTVSGDKYSEGFILEKGNLTAQVDSNFNILVTGTAQNDVLADFHKQTIQLGKQANEIAKKYARDGKPLDAAAQDSFKLELKKLNENAPLKPLDLMMKHVNTPAGTLLFLNSFYEMSVKEKEDLFAKMNVETKAIPRVAQLIAGTEVEKKTSEGADYVNFTMNDPAGKPIALADLVGKTDYLLIDFWASWCPSCREALPRLREFYNKNKGQRFEILGVSLDRNKEKWTESIAQFALPWKNVSDLKFWDNEGAKLYAINSIPTTVLIDKNGKVIGRNLELEKIQELLNQRVTK